MFFRHRPRAPEDPEPGRGTAPGNRKRASCRSGMSEGGGRSRALRTGNSQDSLRTSRSKGAT
ncbi:hypothetical protein Ga0080574_TMP2347 [Salipiger abyssi]|uniref:Uncharacterized protein n=1 Tax=Salipiger abyssi TaxID=1250539 RepID=A0A1P8UTH6_9RHOB|nr:hypothetical protein Ga0080574_TMP2347 [Salipiger abyssi]